MPRRYHRVSQRAQLVSASGDCISTTPTTVSDRLAVPKNAGSAKLFKQLQAKLIYQATRKRSIRLALLVSNIAVLGVILAFVLNNSQTNASQSSTSTVSSTETLANPLDQVSSADIALTVARMGSLPETTAISNQSQSQAAEIALATYSNNVVSKPQVVATALKSSADIKDYTTVAGDTISSIAAKFGVTSDSIRWSNSRSGDVVDPGVALRIPPVNGIVYTVAAGDTPDSLAARFRSSREKIIAYNDAEIKGLTAGQRIIIPDAVQAAGPAARPAAIRGAFAWGTVAVYGSNGYDYGYCTWYVASRIPVPSNWGNANTWSYYAPASGWIVSKRPVAGSIGQTTGPGYGHVAIVEAVSPDGTMIKYSDMNGLAGWGRVGYTADWVSASRFNNFIYR